MKHVSLNYCFPSVTANKLDSYPISHQLFFAPLPQIPCLNFDALVQFDEPLKISWVRDRHPRVFGDADESNAD